MKSLKHIFILPVLVLFLSACNPTNKSKIMEGDYHGAWYDTMYKFNFHKNGSFKFTSEGHFGYVDWDGTYTRRNDSLFLTLNDTSKNTWGVVNHLYLIDNDTCIIDYELRYDYCKNNKGWHGSEERAFKYPQIKTTDSLAISDVELLLKDALNSSEVSEFITDTLTNIILCRYHEIDEKYNHTLTQFGLPILIKSPKEINSTAIENYVIIDDINYNKNSSRVFLRIMPGFKTILAFYKKKNGEWVRDKF